MVYWNHNSPPNPGRFKLGSDLLPSGLEQTANKGIANGYAPLGADILVPHAYLPEASGTVRGIARIATDLEASAGTLETVTVNPKQLKAGGGLSKKDLALLVWRTSRTGFATFDVVYADDLDLLVLVGDPSTTSANIGSSEDGLIVTTRYTVSDSNKNFRCVAYGDGLFVALGWAGGANPLLATSSDGINWAAGASPPGASGGVPEAIAYGAGLFVATIGATLWTSPDGTTWTQRTAPTFYSISKIIWAEGPELFVAVGRQTSNHGIILTSPDGVTWTEAPVVSTVKQLTSVAYAEDKGLFVACGYGTTAGIADILTSTDAAAWVTHTGNQSDTPNTYIAYAAELGLFVGANSTVLFASPNGTEWEAFPNMDVSASNMHIVYYSKRGQILAFKSNGTILSSLPTK